MAFLIRMKKKSYYGYLWRQWVWWVLLIQPYNGLVKKDETGAFQWNEVQKLPRRRILYKTL